MFTGLFMIFRSILSSQVRSLASCRRSCFASELIVFSVALLLLLERKVISFSSLSDSNSKSMLPDVQLTLAFMFISLTNFMVTCFSVALYI